MPVEFVMMGEPPGHILERGIAGPMRVPEHPAQRDPTAVVDHAEGAPLVLTGARVRALRSKVRVAVANSGGNLAGELQRE